MSDWNLSAEPENSSQEDLSNSVESESSIIKDIPNDSLSIEESNVNLVESNSTCKKCSGTDKTVTGRPRYVWAYGKITTRFPDECISREYQLAIQRLDTKGLSDTQVKYEVLKKPENRYLLRKICWVLQVTGIDTYILLPTDIQDYGQLVEAINPEVIYAQPKAGPLVNIIIGTRGPIANPSMCNCLPLPIVTYDRIFTFNILEMINKVVEELTSKAKEERTFMADEEKAFRETTFDIFSDIVFSTSDNVGGTDEHRAINFMLTDPNVYRSVRDALDDDNWLESINARPARVSGIRTMIDVIFTYKNRKTNAIYEEFIRVDVTCEFPFIVSELRQILAHL